MYTIENAKSSRSTCQKCKKIIKEGTIRLVSEASNGYMYYTHWKCVTKKQLNNLKLHKVQYRCPSDKRDKIKNAIKTGSKRTLKNSSKKLSVKRRSIKKRSIKKRSVKKRSVKKRSVKKRSVKKRSVKKYSIKH